MPDRLLVMPRANPPQIEGVVVSLIPLPKTGTLVFGRSSQDHPPSPLRVDLDAADHSISGEHVRITRAKDSFLVEDVSRLGTSLNGDAFSQATLVYGDRVQIGHYKFEFDGRCLRWLNNPNAGFIIARNLTRRAGNRAILDKVSLQVRPGEIVGILGGSGQGNPPCSTRLCGLIPASEGEVSISGQPLTDRAGMRKLGIGYVPQDDIVHKELKVKDALLLSGRLRINLPLPLIRAASTASSATRFGRASGQTHPPAIRRPAQAGQHRHRASIKSFGAVSRRAPAPVSTRRPRSA